MGRFAGIRAALGHIHDPSGFTMVEMLVAMSILLVGMLGTFLMVGSANNNLSKTKAREGATNLARELLETAHETAYANVGQSGWFTSTLQNVSGGNGTVTFPASNSARTTVTRRKIAYTTTVSWCSVDDSGDGYGAHGSSVSWCSGSSTTGSTDSQAEDFKRATVTVSWAYKGVTQPTLNQAATFASTGSVVGPTTTSLSITSPTGLDPTTPTVTSNPSGGIVAFLGSSVGASSMAFTVNGVDQASGITNNGNGTWSFNWNITSLKDGTYTIGAIAVDALGTRGQPRSLTVKLARGAATAPQNVTGGYNYVYVSGTKTVVAELDWDASPEGSVTGYEVRNGSTIECATSLSTSCIDFTPTTSGSTTYQIRTYYTDGAGATQFVSTNFTVTISGGSYPNLYGFKTTTANTGLSTCPTNGAGSQRDLDTNFVTSGGSDSSFTGAVLVGCLPAFPAGVSMTAGTGTLNIWLTNTSNSKTCYLSGYLALNATTGIGGTYFSSGAGYAATVPSKTNSATRFTFNFALAARSFAAGDQISWWQEIRPDTDCGSTTAYYNSGAHQSTLNLPLTMGYSIVQPSVPTGLTVTVNGDGTRTLRWTPPSSSSPAVDFYRIYRDGSNYTNRYDTSGATQNCPSSTDICWTDLNTGGTSHTYRVTSASQNLVESDPVGPVTG